MGARIFFEGGAPIVSVGCGPFRDETVDIRPATIGRPPDASAYTSRSPLAPAAGGRRLNSARVAGGRVGLIDHGLIRHHNNLRADTQIRLGPYVPTLPSLGTTEQILQAPQYAWFARAHIR